MSHSDRPPPPAGPPAVPFLVVGAALLAGIALLVFHPIGTGDTYLHLAAGR